MCRKILYWVEYSDAIEYKYSGRACVEEYWWNILFSIIILFIVPASLLVLLCIYTILLLIIAPNVVGSMLPGFCTILSGVFVGITLATCAYIVHRLVPISVRRLHDIGMPAWAYLLVFLAAVFNIYILVVLPVLWWLPGTSSENVYGLGQTRS